MAPTPPAQWLKFVVASAVGLVLMAAAAGFFGFGPGQVASAPRLPRLGTMASFSLTDQQGKPFALAQLDGRPWVASFLFTRCPTICPRTTAQLAGVQRETASVGAKLRFVSFSVDPDHDTPERLKTYATRFGADPRWTLLTGPLGDIRAAVVDGLKVAMDGRADGGDVSGLLHGTRFVLIDGQNEIRGYYASEDPEALKRLTEEATALAEWTPTPKRK